MTAQQSAVLDHRGEAACFVIGMDVGGTFTDLVCIPIVGDFTLEDSIYKDW